MKYWILPLLICLGVSGAKADPLTGDHLYNYNSPLINITTGVQIGQQNTIQRNQTGYANVFGVEQISILRPGQNGGNDAVVTQLGTNNVTSIGQTIIGTPAFVSQP